MYVQLSWLDAFQIANSIIQLTSLQFTENGALDLCDFFGGLRFSQEVWLPKKTTHCIHGKGIRFGLRKKLEWWENKPLAKKKWLTFLLLG